VKPVALVTGEVSPYRREPFRLLAEAEGLEVLAFRDAGVADDAGGAGAADDAGDPVPGLTVRHTTERNVARLIASGRYRAVIAGLAGRTALPASYLAARRARIPFVLWTGIWAHPRSPAHALSYLPTRQIYKRADAVVTYGPHVSAYVQQTRRRGDVFEAPQAVSADEFGADVEPAPIGSAGFTLLFVGRLVREKGVRILLDAWRRADLPENAILAFAGEGPIKPAGRGVRTLGRVERSTLPRLYKAADALVLPSIRTATFLEPWGLVVNEAMHQGTPVIASDAVGAVAGGLVKDGRNGLVVPAGDAQALATRIAALARNPELREQLGQAAGRDVQPFSEAAWVEGMQRALQAVGAAREAR
jgi:glycosyltransferase involved in cell wall biosynthesis